MSTYKNNKVYNQQQYFSEMLDKYNCNNYNYSINCNIIDHRMYNLPEIAESYQVLWTYRQRKGKRMKRKKKWLQTVIAAGVIAAALAACGENKNGQDTNAAQEDTVKTEYKKITAEEAKERMDKDDKIVILDVRTEEEYKEDHVPGALVIPNETIGSEPLEELPDPDQEILVYCRSGNRSAQAAKKLIEAGYTQVYDFGGIMDWPYDTEK